MRIKIGLVDDHVLFGKSLITLLQTFVGFRVVVDASNGIELLEKMEQLKVQPDIMLIDVEMPLMDGSTTAQILKKRYPTIRLVALSMNDSYGSVISMIQSGCCSYLLKDSSPEILEEALREVYVNNYYNSEIKNNSLGKLLVTHQSGPVFSDLELEFIRLASSEITYREIATIMNVTDRTIETHRAIVFEKLNVQTRTGMVMEAIRKGLVKL
jgi:DNA-binding NarL/FixJ family response regulator